MTAFHAMYHVKPDPTHLEHLVPADDSVVVDVVERERPEQFVL